MSLSVTVITPCNGTQTVNSVSPNLYQGTSGDFTLVILSSDPNQGWLLTVYDYSNPTGPCYPSVTYGQVTPNASDPKGSYGKMVDGSPDTTAGSASVDDA